MLTTTSNLSSAASELASPVLVNFTKVLNEVGKPNQVDIFMDSIKGVGHRIKHGHDLSDLPVIFEKFGWDGVGNFFKHLIGADFMSPHGIPVLPFTYEIGKAFGLSTKQIVDWMCVNIGEAFSGTLAITNSYLNFKLISTGTPDGKKLFIILLSSGIKLAASTANPNPITFLSSVFDIGLIAYSGTPMLIDHFFPKYSFNLSAIGSVKAGSFSITVSALYLGAKEWYEKKDLREIDYKMIAKESSITGLSASIASMIYDSSKYFVTKNEIVNSAISISSFIGTRMVLQKFSDLFKSVNERYVKNSDSIFDLSFIPGY